jgi:hypothetical protein
MSALKLEENRDGPIRIGDREHSYGEPADYVTLLARDGTELWSRSLGGTVGVLASAENGDVFFEAGPGAGSFARGLELDEGTGVVGVLAADDDARVRWVATEPTGGISNAAAVEGGGWFVAERDTSRTPKNRALLLPP